jgi:hypothetical protein
MTRMQSSQQNSAALQSPDISYTRNANNYFYFYFYFFFGVC